MTINDIKEYLTHLSRQIWQEKTQNRQKGTNDLDKEKKR